MKQKLSTLSSEYLLPYLMILNILGIDAIIEIFVKNFKLFFIQQSNDENKVNLLPNNSVYAVESIEYTMMVRIIMLLIT